MHFVVCIKEIPNPEIASSLFRVDEEAKRVIPVAGLALVVSPFDEQAVEAALRLRDDLGEARITVLCMGPESARKIIKDALSLGADEAFLLCDQAFAGADGYTTALTLSAAIERIGGVDLVLTGRQAADWDAGVVGCGIAELLGVPAITCAASLHAGDAHLRVERVLDDGYETVTAPLPAVVSVSHELGKPRHASLRETMRAARKPITVWTAGDLGLEASKVGASAARRVLERLYVPRNDVVCEFIEGGSPEELATGLVRRLIQARAIQAAGLP